MKQCKNWNSILNQCEIKELIKINKSFIHPLDLKPECNGKTVNITECAWLIFIFLEREYHYEGW